MKRVVTIVLIICIIVLIPVAAFSVEPFFLRSGFYWGMPKDEAMVLAEAEGLSLESEEATSDVSIVVQYNNVPVGEHMAEIFSLAFHNSQETEFPLYLCTYSFPSLKNNSPESESMQDSLYSNLVSVYGEPSESSSDSLPIVIVTWLLPDTKIELWAMEREPCLDEDGKLMLNEDGKLVLTSISFSIRYISLEGSKEVNEAREALATDTPKPTAEPTPTLVPTPTPPPIINNGF